MTEPNISREAVECAARYYDDEGRHMEVANNVGDVFTAEYAKMCRDTADMLRALFAEGERLREALRGIAHSADYDTIISPDGDRHQQAVEIALEAFGEAGR